MYRKYLLPRPALDKPIAGVIETPYPLLGMCLLLVPTQGATPQSEAELALPEDAETVKEVAACIDYSTFMQLDRPPSGVAHDNRIGLGVPIYVLSTGIRNHEEFGERLLPGQNFTLSGTPNLDFVDFPLDEPASSVYLDFGGQGTLTAGLAAGANIGSARADVLPIRVLAPFGKGSTDTVLAGLEWIMTQPDGGFRGVVCSGFSCLGSRLLDEAFARVQKAGFRVVLSANLAQTEDPPTAAQSAGALVVAAFTTNEKGEMSAYADYYRPDLWAPSSAVGAWVDGTYGAASGTTMAVGVAAGLLAAYDKGELLDRSLRGNLADGTPIQILQP